MTGQSADGLVEQMISRLDDRLADRLLDHLVHGFVSWPIGPLADRLVVQPTDWSVG